jgi:hypothetical protein
MCGQQKNAYHNPRFFRPFTKTGRIHLMLPANKDTHHSSESDPSNSIASSYIPLLMHFSPSLYLISFVKELATIAEFDVIEVVPDLDAHN